MTRTRTVAEMTLREITRRRGVLLILLLMPLAFYLTRRGDHLGQSVRFVCLGLGWALSTAALFTGTASRALEPRLRLTGYATHQLLLGRLAALWLLGLVLSAPYLLLIRLDQPDVGHGAVALSMALMVAVAAPFGLAVAALLPRDMEGTLVLLTVVGTQMTLDPSDPVARLLPFWFSRELSTYAVDDVSVDHLSRGLAHGLGSALLLLAVAAALAAARLRRRPHLRFV
ncbi:hypothetical protein E1283_07935 [Streptomyces hainanensis]|uniref:Uncharacterized protein n=1 Tax=Streptomyces hainanensis TaxID=402648 RepID=A0A4R4TKW9_9ACTN|nr:hypothetical protein E1283_07935 [Streptomyces hainanensis]